MKRKFTPRLLGPALLALLFALLGITWVYSQDSPANSSLSSPDTPGNTSSQVSAPLGAAFTYQGELQDAGQPASGIYDFSFRLLDGPDPMSDNQVGSPVAVNGVSVSDGIFTVELDFGAGPFTGDARWLEISVGRDGESLTTLSPTQPLTAVPYALYGEDADADPANELNSGINFIGTTLQVTDAGGTLTQNLGTFNGNLVITANGRLGVRELSPITDVQITQSDGLIGGTGGLTFSRSTNWKIMHTGSHLSFVENNVRRSYIETGTGNYVTVSDATKKKDVQPLGTVLDNVMQLQPVQFHYLTQDNSAPSNYGFIAQDVATVFPDLARTAEDGTMGLSYADFGVLAIASIQEQQAQIDALQKENEALRAEINDIRSMLNQGNTTISSTTSASLPAAPLSASALRPDGLAGSLFSSWAGVVLLGLVLLGGMLFWNRQQRGSLS
ncbi:MAG: tail fiber domain-containing protein [Ardenticatenaceae bacterium]|nr:tail fiber domain-containing protein [Ardenticatenaceae bacterium]MCB8988026.1 tail fiber domain-containing protein [Ardenticatenaceae bacterium]